MMHRYCISSHFFDLDIDFAETRRYFLCSRIHRTTFPFKQFFLGGDKPCRYPKYCKNSKNGTEKNNKLYIKWTSLVGIEITKA